MALELLSQAVCLLSPHADDAVLSCGGLLALAQDLEVLTLFSGEVPEAQRAVWPKLAAPEIRREEDRAALALLNLVPREFGASDAAYRADQEGVALYPRFPALFGRLHVDDIQGIADLCSAIEKEAAGRILLCPMAVGAHVDHQLTALVGRRLARQGGKVWFYEDAPYVFPKYPDTVMKAASRMRGRVMHFEDLDIAAVLAKKEAALSQYKTQVEALFGSLAAYRAEAGAHHQSLGQVCERYYKLAFR